MSDKESPKQFDQKNIYLALVNPNFTLTPEVEAYFRDEGAKIEKHMERLGIIKLSSLEDLLEKELRFVSHIELDQVVDLIQEEE